MALWKLYLIDPQYGCLGYDGFHNWESWKALHPGRPVRVRRPPGAGRPRLRKPTGARRTSRHWGGEDLDALSRYERPPGDQAQRAGRLRLGLTDTYQPASSDAATTQPLKVLPNLDIVATGDVPAADRLFLSAHAKQTADHVWTSRRQPCSPRSTPAATSRVPTFLTQRTEHELPNTLSTQIADVHRRAGQLTDLGHARVIECATPPSPRSSPTTAASARCATRLATGTSPSRRARTEVPQSPDQTRLRRPGATTT